MPTEKCMLHDGLAESIRHLGDKQDKLLDKQDSILAMYNIDERKKIDRFATLEAKVEGQSRILGLCAVTLFARIIYDIIAR